MNVSVKAKFPRAVRFDRILENDGTIPIRKPGLETPLGPVTTLGGAMVPSCPCPSIAPKTADGRIDGPSFCHDVVRIIRDLKRRDPNKRCVVVFDLDNTLFDTRARTRAVLEAFDTAHGTSHFKNLELDDIRWNGRETCGALRLDEATSDAVDLWWEEHFWSGAYFVEDAVMEAFFDMAWEAKEAGAQVRYLTGRIEALRGPSLHQIRAAGLPDAHDDHLFLKPNIETLTGEFKTNALFDWLDDGVFLGWFMTDNRQEIEAVRTGEQTREAPSMPCVHVEHKLQRAGTVARTTPTYDEATTAKLISAERAARRAKRRGPRRPAV